MSQLPRPRLLAKAIFVPSGDQAGEVSMRRVGSSAGTTSVPSLFMTKISTLPARVLEKTILSPSR